MGSKLLCLLCGGTARLFTQAGVSMLELRGFWRSARVVQGCGMLYVCVWLWCECLKSSVDWHGAPLHASAARSISDSGHPAGGGVFDVAAAYRCVLCVQWHSENAGQPAKSRKHTNSTGKLGAALHPLDPPGTAGQFWRFKVSGAKQRKSLAQQPTHHPHLLSHSSCLLQTTATSDRDSSTRPPLNSVLLSLLSQGTPSNTRTSNTITSMSSLSKTVCCCCCCC